MSLKNDIEVLISCFEIFKTTPENDLHLLLIKLKEIMETNK